jgi:hypothetical protein
MESTVPIGAIAAAGVLTFLRVDQPLRKLEGSLLYKIRRFDPLGNLCFIAAIISLLLAVHWGGRDYAYSSARFIILMVFFGVLLICFIAIQRWQGDNAIGMPPFPPSPLILH